MSGPLRPIGKRRLATQVAQSLRRYIVEQALRPGDRLPSERDLAAALAVSRHVVREALRLLAEEGVVAVEQGKDTLIRRDPAAVAALELPEPGPEIAQEALEARAIFEAGLAECIIERATGDDILRLEAIVAEMGRRVALGHPGNEDDFAFHEHLHACTHNPILAQIGRAVVLTQMRRQLMRTPIRPLLDSPEAVHPEAHAAIVAAIRARDAASLRHLLRTHPYAALPAPREPRA